jgi:hypothetical protein
MPPVAAESRAFPTVSLFVSVLEATKHDLFVLRTELRTEIDELRVEVADQIAQFRAEVAEQIAKVLRPEARFR